MTNLVDQYGRQIDYLRISVTDRCNLRCRYCMPPEGVDFIDHEQILSYEEIVKIAQVGANLGIKKVRLTGGEPLVRTGITDLISKLTSISGIEELSLTTNGVLLADYGVKLKEAGLARVNISLDTLQGNKFQEITGFNKLPAVIEGIEAVLDLGLTPVKLNVVVMQGINDDELFSFIELTRDYPLHVRFIEFMPVGGNQIAQKDYYLGSDQLKNKIKSKERLVPTQFDQGNGPADYYQVPDSRGTIGFISPLSDHFCGTCNRLRLTATGGLKPCLSTPEIIDLKSVIREDQGRLEDAFLTAVQQKPKEHSLVQDSVSQNMSQIGG